MSRFVRIPQTQCKKKPRWSVIAGLKEQRDPGSQRFPDDELPPGANRTNVELEFTKLSGAGNDFIAINNMDGKIPEEGRRELFSSWCRRGLSVGADGVLLVEPPTAPASGAHFRMRYYNADGGEVETCGNGSRCIARFACEIGIAPSKMRFETLAGPYAAIVLQNGDVCLEMSDAADFQPDLENIDLTEAENKSAFAPAPIDFINTGVPHAVMILQQLTPPGSPAAPAASQGSVALENYPVIAAGRLLRHHPAFAPAGTNANFVEIVSGSRHELRVRTYERGVEDETLACGTGCIASAIVASRRGLVEPPVKVQTRGGEQLIVNFIPTSAGATGVTLQGSARIVFRGVMSL